MLHIKYFNERIHQYKSVSVILTICCTKNQQEKPLPHVILSLSPSSSCHSLAVSIPLETETIATKNNSAMEVQSITVRGWSLGQTYCSTDGDHYNEFASCQTDGCAEYCSSCGELTRLTPSLPYIKTVYH